jgi:hypothetical protein
MRRRDDGGRTPAADTRWSGLGGGDTELDTMRDRAALRGAFEIQKCETPIFLSGNKTVNTIRNRLQAFLELLEFRIIGSAGDTGRDTMRDRAALHGAVQI